MKCTSCNSGYLKPSFIDELFRSHTCTACGGNWILIEDYVSWKERHPEHTFATCLTASEEEIVTRDTKKALLCPVTGAIMQKFRFSAGSDRRIDYSPPVGGIWLDRGEWELLKAEGLSGSLNAVVTSQWQKELRENSAREGFAEIYRNKFGDEAYSKIREMRAWLLSQENKSDLRAYLLAQDPYSAER